ncbi:multicopper oxidase domain-containing protein [Streptomyces sp. NPDC002405]
MAKPGLKIDAVTAVLLAVTAVPWLAALFELPGGTKFQYKRLVDRIEAAEEHSARAGHAADDVSRTARLAFVADGSADDEGATGSTVSEPEVVALEPGRAAVTRDFHFRGSVEGWTINGPEYQPGRALARPRPGQTEVWRFTTNFHHPVHLHLNHFQVVSRNNGEPGAYDHGWKHTVSLRAAEAVEVVVRFTDCTGPFMLHCHNLEHEDMAMMGDFVTR